METPEKYDNNLFKVTKRAQVQSRSAAFTDNFEQILYTAMGFPLLLTLNN